MMLTDAEKIARLRLIRSEGIGPVLFSRLLAKHTTALAAIKHLENNPQNQPKSFLLASHEVIKQELDKIEHYGAHLIFKDEAHYPELLAEISDAPPALLVKGRMEILQYVLIGVVGARNASASGMKLTHQICAALATEKVGIVSGLARGIDTASHSASLTTGTIACLAGGLDVIYPPENAVLHQKIAETGLLISEMPMGTKPQARHFPRRNRIISGLSSGLLVIEAAQKSGSLITARYAADQGRDVYAVPGSPLDPRSAGTNQLLKDGAILVRTAEDILCEIDTQRQFHLPVVKSISQPAEKHPTYLTANITSKAAAQIDTLLTFLTSNPLHIDDIARVANISPEKILSEFLPLEIEGKIERHSGNRFSRIYTKNE
ncbi:DNA-processing protein DprA [Kordiimonas pumila]|uniref:DNA-processing protein DprA n=2 Tax=Kordiimonas pumila TaxID=2161677 RepID=A0ABV7D0P6_9PROT